MKRFYFSVVLACLLVGSVWAKDDPFCGRWKLNMGQSKFVGEQWKIEDLGGNKYRWTFGSDVDTITADGTDQPDHFGRTTSLIQDGANNWKMVIKKDGRVISSMTHTFSADGKTQTIKGTNVKPDGTTSDFVAVWKKVGAGNGWAGTWESADVKFSGPGEYVIEAFEGDGLTFNTPAYKDVLSMKFDGKDYEEKGPDVAPGSTSSGKRVDERTIEVTDKVKGKVMDRSKFEVSADGKKLTVTVHDEGQSKSILIVYDKI